MLLTHILKSHNLNVGTGKLIVLRDCLGDPYLLAHNQIYRNIRQYVVASGFHFTNQRFADHHSFPLLALESVLREKTIPYIDNVSILKKVVSKNKALRFDKRIPLVGSNAVMHESAHACARSIIETLLPLSNKKTNRQSFERDWALNLLIEESFANACDLAVWLGISKPLDHFFLKTNSYLDGSELFRKNKWLKNHFHFYFKLLILVFLYLNFLYDSISKKEFSRAVAFVKSTCPKGSKEPTSNELDMFLRTINKEIGLSSTFRLVTTEFYFKYLGFETAYPKLLSFDFLSKFESNENYRETFVRLQQVVFNDKD